ncbi:hypothetical protein WJX82_004052 [Trebouxia sp. C0006]
MEISLHRFDVLQTGATAQDSLKVLPQGQNRQQKLAVGDSAGVVQCVSVKKGEIVAAFKTLPTGQPVSHVTLGRGQAIQRDKIFVAQGQTVQGFTKKGKQFYNFDTNLAERISTLHVSDNSIWLTGEYTFTQLTNHVEAQFYIAPDRINDSDLVTLAPVSPGYAEPCVVLGCQDYTIRILERSTLIHQINVEGAVTVVKHIADSHDTSGLSTGRQEVLYGTHNGVLGQLFLDHQSVKQGWLLKPSQHKGAIKAIYSAIDFSKDGINEVVIGRDTGSLEVYGFDQHHQPALIFQTSLEESISSIDGGFFTSPNVQDVLVQTYSGKVVAFSEEEVGSFQPSSAPASPLKRLTTQFSKAMQNSPGVEEAQEGSVNKVQAAEAEVAELQRRVECERQAFAQVSANLIASTSHFDLKDSLVLDVDDVCHVLTVETGGPIFSVAVQSGVLLDLEECPVAILSKSPPDPAGASLTLATYRCQESTNRVAIRMHVVEGQYGTVQAFVVPQTSPRVCKAAVHVIKPLCMHHRLNAWEGSVPMNELQITGNFDMADVHSWLASSLPDVPPRAPVGDSGVLFFQGAVYNSTLVCHYKRGELLLRSDNLSSLAILREFITKEATMQKKRIQLSFKLDPESISHSMRNLWPRMKRHMEHSRENLLLEALQEIKMQEGDCSFLAADLESLLETAGRGKDEQAKESVKLEYLIGLVKDMFLDWRRFSGVTTSKSRLGQLTELLHDNASSCQRVIDFVLNTK